MRINRVGVSLAVLLMAYLAFLSDPYNFPEYRMLLGRMYAVVPGWSSPFSPSSPALRRYGVALSFLVFLVGGLMMAHLTAVMDNHYSDVIAWTFVNIIFCGIYPLPLLYSFAVLLISIAYYVAVYFGQRLRSRPGLPHGARSTC